MNDNPKTEMGSPRVDNTWSNKKCIEIAYSDNFPASVRDISIQKNIINRYLNFYLGAKVKTGLSVTDLTYAVISIMPARENTEDFIWHKNHYKEKGTLFFLTPEDKLKVEIQNTQVTSTYEDEQLEEEPAQQTRGYKRNGHQGVKETVGEESETKLKDNKTISVENNDRIESENAKEEGNTQNISSTQETDEDATLEQDNETKATTSTSKGAGESSSSIPTFPQNLRWYDKSYKLTVVDENRPKYGPVENAAFTASCNRLLENWDRDKEARIVLKYFFGIVALISMRATTKKYMHLVNTFGSNKFLTFITSSTSYNLSYSIPRKRFVKYCYRTFRKRDGNIPIMFAKIINGSLYVDSNQSKSNILSQNLNIFKLTVLAHTVDYGFGIVSLLQRIQRTGVAKIVEATYCDITANSWKKLIDFLEQYMADTSKEVTHHWARIISTDYFKHLSCSANYELAVILAVFIEKITMDSGIWQSAWVKSNDDLEALKERGNQMYEVLRAAEMKEIKEFLKEFRKQFAFE